MDQASRLAFYLLLLTALILISWSARRRQRQARGGRNQGERTRVPAAARRAGPPSQGFPTRSVRRVG